MKVTFQKKAQDPTVQNGIKVNYAPAKRKTAQLRWYVILLCVSSPLLYFLYKLLSAWLIVGAQGFISLEKTAVNATAVGVVDHLEVTVGQQLVAGQVVARLHNADLTEELALRKAERAAFQKGAPLRGRNSGERRLRRRLSLARENRATGRAYLENVRFLFTQGAATVAELNLARERYNRVVVEEGRVLDDLEALKAAEEPLTDRETTTQAAARIDAQIASLKQAGERLAQRTPNSGRVLDIMATEGSALAPGAPILLLGHTEKPYVVAYLNPKYARYARQGQTAQVGLPDGSSLPAEVRTDAALTKRLPADLSSPVGSRDIMLLVMLELKAPLPDIQWVDGLPVSVRFDFKFF